MFIQKIIVALSRWAYQRPWLAVVLVVGLTAILSVGFSDMRIETTNDQMFQQDDPALVAYRQFQRQFGRDDIILAAITSDQIFTGEFMEQLRAFHEDLEQMVPWLDDVTSLVNADWIAAVGEDQLKVGDLGKEWPLQGPVTDKLRQEVIASPLYQNSLVTKDGQMTLIAVRALAFASEQAKQSAAKIASAEGVPQQESVKEKIIRWHDEFNAYLAGQSVTPNPRQGAESVTDDFFQEQISNRESTSLVDSDGKNDENSKMSGLSEYQFNEFISAVEKVAAKHRTDGFDIRLAGGPIVDKAHQDSIHTDALRLMLLAIMVIIVALVLLLRTKLAVFLPLLVIFLALVGTLGLMGWFGMPISVVSQALPPILLMAGVLDSVHLLGIYYARVNQGETTEIAIASAFEHSGVAVFYTSLTTAAGFYSFTTASLKPISDFGWMAAFGVLLVLLYSILLLPAIIKLVVTKSAKIDHQKRWNRISTYLIPLANYGVKRDKYVITGFIFLVLAGIPGVLQLNFSHDVLSWFPDSEPVKINTLEIDKKLQATVPMEVVVDTGKINGILTPDFMLQMQTFQDYAESIQEGPATVGRSSSIVDRLERIHTQLSSQDTQVIPTNEALLHQEILLYEGGGAREISRLVDRSYSKARITLNLNWADARDYVPLRDHLKSKAQEIFGDTAEVSVSGTVDLVSAGSLGVIQGMQNSYLTAALLISVMLIVLWRHFVLGFIALLPNFFPVYIGLALMGYFGIPINMFTVLLGGIALGLAVDDTVHLIHGINRESKTKNHSIETAVLNTVRQVGPILAITTVVLSSGFLMFGFSKMAALGQFGMLLAMVLTLALIVDLLLIPALMSVIGPRWLSSYSYSTAQEANS